MSVRYEGYSDSPHGRGFYHDCAKGVVVLLTVASVPSLQISARERKANDFFVPQ